MPAFHGQIEEGAAAEDVRGASHDGRDAIPLHIPARPTYCPRDWPFIQESRIFSGMSERAERPGSRPLSAQDAEEGLRHFFEATPPDGVASVYLFGSTVRDSPNRERDLDVGVVVRREAHPTTLDRSRLRVGLIGDLMVALGTNRIDLVILNDVSPELGRAVIRSGRRVALLDPETDHAFVRDVQLRAADLDIFLRRMRKIKLDALGR